MSDIAQELDARKLNCPLPILRAKKVLDTMEHHQILRIIATDPGSVEDFASFCTQTGNELLSSEQNGEEFIFQIRKK